MRTLGDVQFAVRTLIRAPGFTALVILTLAVGIGASTAIFTVVNAIVLRPLDYPQPEQLVRITSELRGFGATDTGVASPELFDYQSRTDLFSAVAGLLPVSANVTSGGTPERITTLDMAHHERTHRFPTILPDGRTSSSLRPRPTSRPTRMRRSSRNRSRAVRARLSCRVGPHRSSPWVSSSTTAATPSSRCRSM